MSEDITNMKDAWLFDKNFSSLSDEIFDDAMKLLDFPLEDVENNFPEEDWDAQLKHLEEPSFDIFSMAPYGLCDSTQHDNPKLKLGRSFSACNEISPIKQQTETLGFTYTKCIPNPNVSSKGKDLHLFRTYSPVSVFESSSSSSGENCSFDLPIIPVKGARSKRRRLSSFSPLFSISFISKSPALQKSQRTAASELDLETQPNGKLLNRVKGKQRKRDLSLLSGPVEMKRSSSQESVVPRKCTHCEVTKTPQWREGPLGPKTLCNACGVRYRSGRLFPEYRPAASPAFVESKHSNCHKKVIEMRNSAIHMHAQGAVGGSMLTSSSNISGNFLG
ncbi:hypothetical protein L6164_021984 [Bauhinia variegata]|uniref:Uncharacterized protein n=1 Tax=Bauhinia variegata TaxID=167791 RepID=A0ACB9MDK0_BAUVA|nr:hypothetical protein L6164_021984 [Bauhinia variegata]